MLRTGNVTIKDIAQVLNVSAKTISSALNGTGRISDKMRQKIQQTATEMGYVRNAAARALVTKSSNFIGVIIPYINNSFFANIIAGMEKFAGDRGYMLLIDTFEHRDKKHQARLMSMLLEHNVDGLIVYPSPEIYANRELFQNCKRPIVQIMNHYPELGANYVKVDNFAGSCQAVEHLIGRGHRHIGLIGHDQLSPELQERHRGYSAVIEAHQGVEMVEQCEVSISAGEQAALKLLEKYPQITAIFAASDYAAIGALQAAVKLQRPIPHELAVIGFDNLDIAANQVFYPLTTIAQPQDLLGQQAVELMLDLIAGKNIQNITLNTDLIIRHTT